jgi:hypothetical protein
LIIDGWVRPDQWRDNFRPDHPDVAHDSEVTVVRLSFSRREGASPSSTCTTSSRPMPASNTSPRHIV